MHPFKALAVIGTAWVSCTSFVTATPYTDLQCFSTQKWNYVSGQEFPGARGAFSLVEVDQRKVGLLTFDFTNGGLYVAGTAGIEIQDGFEELRLRVKSNESQKIIIRLIDCSNQIHQYTLSYTDKGDWQLLRIVFKHKASLVFGGSKDGKLHFPIKKISLGVEKNSAEGHSLAGEVLFADVMLLK